MDNKYTDHQKYILEQAIEINQLRSERDRYKAALERISHLKKLTLICDPADFDFNAEDATRYQTRVYESSRSLNTALRGSHLSQSMMSFPV